MFSGIVECTGVVSDIQEKGSSRVITIESPFSKEAYIDQSIAHDGVCLTVVSCNDTHHIVEAVFETLQKTNLSSWLPGKNVNLERSVTAGGRMDGHFVQGHVDCVAELCAIDDIQGSWYFHFEVSAELQSFMVEKGSICLNGVSLTLADVKNGAFTVAIIPYTYEHTTFKHLKPGEKVNVEFDILGKYIVQYLTNLKLG
ncbi:MAG: riboflavin synthase [Saprospiraceae bacterium]|jgi:riboflavin synthase|nr:riboflavin synthase [Saprospiraceae bacterium]